MPSLPFAIEDLEALAGPLVYARGCQYFTAKRVKSLAINEHQAIATVVGTTAYKTMLKLHKGDLEVDCTCPHAEEGFFCKHGVAVGLAWLDQPELYAQTDQGVQLRNWLEQQPHATLVHMLMDFAEADSGLLRNLRVASQIAMQHSPANLRRLIDDATETDGYLDWRSELKLETNVTNMVHTLRNQLNAAPMAQLPELCEYAIRCLISLTEEIDESNGMFEQSLGELQVLHREAYERLMPNPLELAQHLLDLELEPILRAFHNTVTDYDGVLGEAGKRHFQVLLQQRWDQLPCITEIESEESNYYGRLRITEMMTCWARQSDDIETLVAVLRKDLSGPRQYLAIAELYHEAGIAAPAIQWAEQGLKVFKGFSTSRLEDFLMQRYLEGARGDEALEMAWKRFVQSTSLANYKCLHHMASALECWPAQRSRALAWLEERPQDQHTNSLRRDQSLRIEIALWEQDITGAWSAFCAGSCRQGLVFVLAEALEDTQPQDAATIYRSAVAPLVEQSANKAYTKAIRLIKRLDSLMLREEFTALCEDLRRRYKAKRNFIKLLDELIHSG